MTPHLIDIIISIPLIWGLYLGFKKGLIIELSTLAALLVGLYGAVRFGEVVGDYISKNLEIDERYVPILAFAVTFILLVILVNMIGKMITKVIDMASLGFLNKLGGGVFRAFKIAMIFSVIIMIVESLDEQTGLIPDDIGEGSVLYGPLRQLAPLVIPVVKNNSIFREIKEVMPSKEELGQGTQP